MYFVLYNGIIIVAMEMTKERRNLLVAGSVVGIIAVLLVAFGNPKNMGFCIACFVRDTAGALKLHSAPVVQYLRPEIIGLVLDMSRFSVQMTLC